MLTRVYRDGVLEAEGFDPALVSDYLDEQGTVVWLDVCSPSADELALIAGELDLHPLAQEDATGRPQRPKIEPYAGHQFLVAFAARWDATTDELDATEVAVFFSARWILTVRKDESFDVAGVVRRWDSAPALAAHGVPFLLHGLLDEIVESHFRVIEQLDDEVEQIEDGLFSDTASPRDVQRQVYQLRKGLVAFRRLVLPMREVINTLLTRDVCPIQPELRPYFQDVFDHVLRISERVDSVRDVVSSAMETHLTIQGNRLNEIMKQLTSYAAIVAVPTAVAGIYGMNVRLHPAPGSEAGWWFALGLMAVISGGLFAYFRRKDWL